MSISYSGDKITFADGSTLGSGWTGFKNRIINGAMMIDQRNAGATVNNPAASSLYTLDRWQIYGDNASAFRIAQSTPGSLPAGFSMGVQIYSLAATTINSGSLYIFRQKIEGYNTADLSWGTANAKSVTLSLWVYSSLTGTYGGALQNNDGTRSYPFTYTVSSANTWTQVSVTVAGDTSGTWNTTTGIGISVVFGLGAGSTYSGTAGSWASANYYSATGATNFVSTNGATMYITGVQLEKGSTATSFDYRPYGTELALCQRYYYFYTNGSENPVSNCCYYNSASIYTVIQMPVSMRVAPTLSATSGSNYYKVYRNSAPNYFNTLSLDHANVNSVDLTNVEGLSGTSGWAGWIRTNNSSSFIAFSAEL